LSQLKMRPEKKRVQQILRQAVTHLCKENVKFEEEIDVQGDLWLTIDKNETIHVVIQENIAQVLHNFSSKHNVPSITGNLHLVAPEMRHSLKATQNSHAETVARALRAEQGNEQDTNVQPTEIMPVEGGSDGEMSDPAEHADIEERNQGNARLMFPSLFNQMQAPDGDAESFAPSMSSFQQPIFPRGYAGTFGALSMEAGISSEEGAAMHAGLLTGEPPRHGQPNMHGLSRRKLNKLQLETFSCGACNVAFTGSRTFAAHMKLHTDEHQLKCTLCDKGFSQRSALSRHMRTHTGEKPYQCGVCDRYFSRTDKLTSHMKIHAGEEMLPCPLCSRKFARTDKLSEHMKMHHDENGDDSLSGENMQGAQIDEQVELNNEDIEGQPMDEGSSPMDQFNQFSGPIGEPGSVEYTTSLIQHLARQQAEMSPSKLGMKLGKKYTGPKNHICKYCGKAFGRKQYLENHVRLHTGEEPFKCELCERRFKSQQHKHWHLKNHHQQTDTPSMVTNPTSWSLPAKPIPTQAGVEGSEVDSSAQDIPREGTSLTPREGASLLPREGANLNTSLLNKDTDVTIPYSEDMQDQEETALLSDSEMVSSADRGESVFPGMMEEVNDVGADDATDQAEEDAEAESAADSVPATFPNLSAMFPERQQMTDFRLDNESTAEEGNDTTADESFTEPQVASISGQSINQD